MWSKFALTFASLLLIASCSDELAVEKFKQTYKKGLIGLCSKDTACIDLIETHFERCIDTQQVYEMIRSEKGKQDLLNEVIVERTMKCIVEAVQSKQ